mgnify:CR=1 FL=1
MADAKVKQALSEDYDSVANLFVRGRNTEGIAGRLAEKLKTFRDPENGVIRSRLRGLERIIKNADQDIEKKTMMADKKEEDVRRRFTALEGQLAQLQSQGNFLAQKMGGDKGG